MKQIFICALMMIITSNLYAQLTSLSTPSLPKISPVSPDAASLGKFSDVPVSYHTGVPSISIPIFSAKQNSRDIAVSLSYHAGGIKVEELASTVGLGWSLQAGGSISRSQRGLPDETAPAVGYFYSFRKAKDFFDNNMNGMQKKAYLKEIITEDADGEADIFHFNFGGYSGKFFFAEDSSFHTIPESKLRITFQQSPYGFRIVTNDGTEYFFTLYETTTVEPYCNGNNNSLAQSNNTWHLTKIKDLRGDSVVFNYALENQNFISIGTDEYNLKTGGTQDGQNCFPQRTYCSNDIHVQAYKLSSIVFRSGRIEFIPQATERTDLFGSYALKEIVALNQFNDTVKKYQFHTSYFTSTTGSGRLRLDSLSEIRNGVRLSPHRFFYNGTGLPTTTSYDQDHWGYFNNRGNSTLVQYQNVVAGPWVGANRDPALYYTKASVLDSIEYPTGGAVTFDYEANSYAIPVTPGFDFNELTQFHWFPGSNAGATNVPQTYQSNFTVASGDIATPGYMLAQMDVGYICSDPLVYNQFSLTITGPNGYLKTDVLDDDTLHLSPGTYTLHATIETEFAGTPSCSFNIYVHKVKYEPRDKKNKVAGGLRIKTIRRYDNVKTIPETEYFRYTLSADTISSGVINGDIPYQLPYTREMGKTGGGDNTYSDYCAVITYNSASTYPLLETAGKPVGYSLVTVQKVTASDSLGKSEMRFSTFTGYPDIVYSGFPFLPPEDHGWRRGLSTETRVYKRSSNSYTSVASNSTAYTPFDVSVSNTTNLAIAKNVKLGTRQFSGGAFSDPNEFEYVWAWNGYDQHAYRVVTEGFASQSDTVRTFTGSHVLENVTRHGFSLNNYLNVADSALDSKDEEVVLKSSYARDYMSDSTQPGFISRLISKNLLQTPVEQLELITQNGNSYVSGGVITRMNPGTLLIDTMYALELDSAILLSNFQQSSATSTGQLLKDSRYKARVIYLQYDSHGNPLSIKRPSDAVHSYVWDYNSSFPTAEVIDSTSADFAVTSFEADGKGYWSFSGTPTGDPTSPTGKKCYNPSGGQITRSGLSSGRIFIISYWGKNGSVLVNGGGPSKQGKTVGDWTYYEHESEMTSVTITGNKYIDELRLYPKDNCKIVTRTYDPLIGITSECDQAGTIMYYEYDAFGRLRFIKDQDRNVIKVIEYQYNQSQNQ